MGFKKGKNKRKHDSYYYSSRMEEALTEKLHSKFVLAFPLFFFTFIAFHNFSKGHIGTGEDMVGWIILGFVISGGLLVALSKMATDFWQANQRALGYLLFSLIFLHAALGYVKIDVEFIAVTLFSTIYTVVAFLLRLRPIAMYYTINLLFLFLFIQAILDGSTRVLTNWGELSWISFDILVIFYLVLEVFTRVTFKGNVWKIKPPEGFQERVAEYTSKMVNDSVKAAVRSPGPLSDSYIRDYCLTCGDRRPCHDCDRVCKSCYYNESMCNCS